MFRFAAVPVSADFPHGVEMHYKAYSKDICIEIIDSDATECGKAARECHSSWNPPGKGIYIMTSLPDAPVAPMPFNPGSRELVEKAVKGIQEFRANIGTIHEDYTICQATTP